MLQCFFFIFLYLFFYPGFWSCWYIYVCIYCTCAFLTVKYILMLIMYSATSLYNCYKSYHYYYYYIFYISVLYIALLIILGLESKQIKNTFYRQCHCQLLHYLVLAIFSNSILHLYPYRVYYRQECIAVCISAWFSAWFCGISAWFCGIVLLLLVIGFTLSQ